MSREEQTQGFRLSSDNQLKNIDNSTLTNNQSQVLIVNTQLTVPIQRMRHVYLEQETTYGRFVPFMLLKDKLKSQLDSSGHTALHHMCSHNSEYLPLYLSTIKKHDPILNRPTRLGHNPLDIAGIYCRKQYVDLLLQKGAIDQGNIDHWAIQGGNIYNWTGKIDPTKKHLPHWAAYNDMPQVLMQFYRQGVNVNDKDGNDLTPIDLATINKSYKSIKVLAELGFRPKQQLLKTCQSKSILMMMERLNEPEKSRKIKHRLKLAFVPLFCLLCFLLIKLSFAELTLSFHSLYLPLILTLLTWIGLTCLITVNPEPIYPNTRRTQFYSDIIGKQVNLKSNHIFYLLLNMLIFTSGVITLLSCQTTSYLISILYIITFYITIVYLINTLTLLIGVLMNLTHEQMFNRDRCRYLWNKVHYIDEKKMLIRKFNNQLDRGWRDNLRKYFSKSLN